MSGGIIGHASLNAGPAGEVMDALVRVPRTLPVPPLVGALHRHLRLLLLVYLQRSKHRVTIKPCCPAVVPTPRALVQQLQPGCRLVVAWKGEGGCSGQAHLPAVHRLLDGASRDEAVDVDVAPLADAECAVHGLRVASRQ